MNQLSSWLERQAARERKAIHLEDALLGGRFAAYFTYRLRLFALRFAVGSIVHAARILILVRVFTTPAFLSVVAVHIAAALATGFWWGALETMRSRVREGYRSQGPRLAEREIGRWLSFSLQLTATGGLLVAAWLVGRVVLGRGIEPVDFYLAAIVLRCCVDLPVRTLHSGVFALRRVYRPLPSLLAVEIVGLAALLILWPALGPWAFGAAELIAAAAVAAISVRYSYRAYRLILVAPWRRLDVRTIRDPARRVRWTTLQAGAATAFMMLEALVTVGVLVAAGGAGAGGTRAAPVGVGGAGGTVTLLILALAPTIQSGFQWTQLIYFDLKRLDGLLMANLRRQFERAAVRLALVLSAILWSAAVAIAIPLIGVPPGPVLVLLLPLIASCSLIAVAQMRAFTGGAYSLVISSGLFSLIALVFVGQAGLGELERMVAMTAVLLVATGLIGLAGRLPSAPNRVMGGDRVLPLPEWLARLAASQSPVRVGVLELAQTSPRAGREPTGGDDDRSWRVRRLAESIAARLRRGGGEATILGEAVIGWFRPASSTRTVDLEWLLPRSGGRLRRHWEADRAQGGQSALAALVSSGELRLERDARSSRPPAAAPLRPGPELVGSVVSAEHATRRAAPSALEAEMVVTFRRMFPAGFVYAPADVASKGLQDLPGVDRRRILRAALRFARDLRAESDDPRFDVSAWCPDGSLRLVFVVDRAVSRRLRARWRRHVRRLTLEAVAGGY